MLWRNSEVWGYVQSWSSQDRWDLKWYSIKELDYLGQQIVVFYMEQWLKLTQIGQDAPRHLVIYMTVSSDAQSHFFETDMVQSLLMMKNAAHLKVFERFYSCSLIQSFKIWFSDLYNGQAIGFKVIN